MDSVRIMQQTENRIQNITSSRKQSTGKNCMKSSSVSNQVLITPNTQNQHLLKKNYT